MTEQMGAQAETVAVSQEQESQAENPNWKAAREAMAQQKQELENVKQQNALLQRWATQQDSVQQQVAQPASPFEGLNKDDVVTVGDLEGVFNKALEQKEQVFNQKIATLEKKQKLYESRSQYENYDEVVRNTMKKAESNPALARAIASSENPHLLAYELGKPDTAKAVQQKADGQRILENAQKPGSVSQASTGGAALSGVDHIMGLSDADFEARIASVKRGGG